MLPQVPVRDGEGRKGGTMRCQAALRPSDGTPVSAQVSALEVFLKCAVSAGLPQVASCILLYPFLCLAPTWDVIFCV